MRKLIALLGLYPVLCSVPIRAATCLDLASLKLSNASIRASETVAAGKFLPPGATPSTAVLATYKSLPAFCRVQGIIQPTSDSLIEFEVWLPISGWNGKYLGVGNGGLAGSITYAAGPATNPPGMAEALLAGYATSSTDTGHTGNGLDAQWALGHREKIVDYGYRAIHETAENSKMVIRAFYGNGPQQSYFSSCSNGGRQALMEAQRFPADYEGIIAGAPLYAFTHLFGAATLIVQATEADPASFIPKEKLVAIESAVLGACDALDGIKDGIIDDPRKCRFDPEVLRCRGKESSACLTDPQLTSLKKIYAGAVSAIGEPVYPGYLPGAETGNGGWASRFRASSRAPSSKYLFVQTVGRHIIFQNPAWDYRSFELGRDLQFADRAMGQSLNATDADLRAFKRRGGKLILYHGWSDPALPPLGTVKYYESVVSKMGEKNADDFVRLYMVPGMQHCGGGPGPDSFAGPITIALERWVEEGAKPDRIIASRYKKDGEPASGLGRTRPLCPYPQVARYKGTGSIDEASNFACRLP